jgi:hypothetical protein
MQISIAVGIVAIAGFSAARISVSGLAASVSTGQNAISSHNAATTV